MEKKELGREDVIEALKKIAFGRVNRGVELTYLSEPTAQLIRKMDLSAVAEFKRNANGTVEVKFVDRVKALSALYEMLGTGDANEAAEFLKALEQAGEEKFDGRSGFSLSGLDGLFCVSNGRERSGQPPGAETAGYAGHHARGRAVK